MLEPGSNHLRARSLRLALAAFVVLLASCASSSNDSSPDTSVPARPGGRVAGEPADDRARTAMEPSESSQPAVLHILGTLALLPESPAAIPQQVVPLQTDLASVVSLGCTPGDDGCEVERVELLESANIEVVNLATAAAGTAEDATLNSTVSTLGEAGIGVIGWGANLEEAVLPLHIRTGGETIALHAISLAEDGADRTAHATADAAGIAGPDAFVALLQALMDSETAGHRVVVAVDWGNAERRSPDEDTVDLATSLVRAGADAVVGSGSEFLNRLEVIDGAPVAFDLGQAATATDDALRRDTAVLRLEFGPTAAETCLLPATANASGPVLDDGLDEDPCAS